MRRTMAYSRKMWRGVAAEACPPVAAPERRWLTRRLTVAPVFSIQCSVLSSSELKTEHWILNTLGRSGAFQGTENTLKGGHRTTAVEFKRPSKRETLFGVQCRMHDAKWKIGCLVSFQSTESTLKGGHRTTAVEFKRSSKREALFAVQCRMHDAKWKIGCLVSFQRTENTLRGGHRTTAVGFKTPSKGEALFAVQCRMHDAKWKIGCLVSFQSTESTLKGGHRTTALEFKTPSKGETLFGVHPLGCPVPEPPTGATRPPSPAATALHIWRP
jgi:hypothetical protein